MSADTEMTFDPATEPPAEVLLTQLDKAAESWETRAEAETQAADGDIAKEMLYRATADAMRHAQHVVEEQHPTHEEGAGTP